MAQFARMRKACSAEDTPRYARVSDPALNGAGSGSDPSNKKCRIRIRSFRMHEGGRHKTEDTPRQSFGSGLKRCGIRIRPVQQKLTDPTNNKKLLRIRPFKQKNNGSGTRFRPFKQKIQDPDSTFQTTLTFRKSRKNLLISTRTE